MSSRLRDGRHGARARPDRRARAAGDLRLGFCRRSTICRLDCSARSRSPRRSRRRSPPRCWSIMWVLATHPERIGGLAGGGRAVLPGKLSGRVGQLASTFSSGFAAARERSRSSSWRVVLVVSALARDCRRGVDGHARVRDRRCRFPGPSCCSRCSSSASRCRRPAASAAFTRPIASASPRSSARPTTRRSPPRIVTHLISFIPPVLGGILFMAQDGLSFGRLEDSGQFSTRQGRACRQ